MKKEEDEFLLDRFDSLDYVQIRNEINAEEETKQGFEVINSLFSMIIEEILKTNINFVSL